MTHTSSPRRDRNTAYGVASPERDRLPTIASAYEPDVQAVITAIEATGATLSPTQKQICSDRIAAMKTDGVWAKRVGYYGYLGATAAAHAINWKSPGTYNIAWNGAVTHSANGVQSTGGYGDTGYNLSTGGLITTSGHLGAYSRTNIGADVCEIGGLESLGGSSYRDWGLFTRWSDGNLYYDFFNDVLFFSSSDSLGVTIVSHASSLAYVVRGAAIAGSKAISTVDLSTVNANLWVCNRSVTGSNPSSFILSHSPREYGSSWFGTGLTTEEAIADSISEQAYQTALGRQV